LHNLVEPDQNIVVLQLSVINQTLCTGRGAIPGEAKDFRGVGTNGEISFFPLETK